MTTQSSAAAEAAIPVPPEAQLMQIVAGCFPSQAVYVAAKLGIADLVEKRAVNSDGVSTKNSAPTNERSIACFAAWLAWVFSGRRKRESLS